MSITGPFSVHPYSDPKPRRLSHETAGWDSARIVIGDGRKMLGVVEMVKPHWGDTGYPGIKTVEEMQSVAALWMAAPEMLAALQSLTELFALPDENSMDRFERLAAMFRKDTGFLAPGKDQPMFGADQPDGNELRAIYDAWYAAKIERARAAIAKATTFPAPATETMGEAA